MIGQTSILQAVPKQEAKTRKMKTKQRILITSLALFNELGEPNVTTVDISNEMEISPGNLYYHYRNKDDIIEHIVAMYEQDMAKIIQAEQALEGLVEHWLFLKVIVEKNWQYRFIFRDFENLVSKYKTIERKLYRLQIKMMQAMLGFIKALVSPEINLEHFHHINALADNMAMILTRSPLQHQEYNSNTETTPSDLLNHTCFQTLITLWPWMSFENQNILEELSMNY